MIEKQVDILIVGAGPAGLSVALTLKKLGKQSLMVDNNIQSGGQIWRQGIYAGKHKKVRQFEDLIRTSKESEFLPGTRIIAANHKQKQIYAETAKDSLVIHYNKLILCVGARERYLPFSGWTLPGVTGAGGLQALTKAGYKLAGKHITIAGTGPLLLASAAFAKQQGAQIKLIAETSSLPSLAQFTSALWRFPQKLMQAVGLINRHYRTGSRIIKAFGDNHLEAVLVEHANGKQRIYACDYLGQGFGLVANTELASLLGCQIKQRAIHVGTCQETSQTDIYAAGECTGIGGSELAFIEGRVAAFAAAEVKPPNVLLSRRHHWQKFAEMLRKAFPMPAPPTGSMDRHTLVCRCEDVTFSQIQPSHDWKTIKTTTRCGMGACQGRICGQIIEDMYALPHTSVRAPISPCRLDTLASLANRHKELL